MHKYNGKYYFSYSTGDSHYLCYAIGDSPYGPFRYQGVVLDPVVGKETELKLIGNNKGYASVPYFISINKDSKESYISNNWLGENLAFTANELTRKQKASEVKPETPAVSDDSSDNLNLDDEDFDI